MFSFRKVRETIGGLVLILTVVGMLALSTIGQVSVHTDNSRLSVNYVQNKVKAAIGITLVGAAQSKASSHVTLDITDGVVVGDVFVVVWAGDLGVSAGSTTAVRKGSGQPISDEYYDVTVSNTGNVVVEIIRFVVTETFAWNGSFPGLIVYNSSGGSYAQTIAVYKVTGLDDTPLDRTAYDTGSGTSPSSGTTAALSQADELIIGAVGVEDEIDDMGGTWTTGIGYVSGNEQGTGTNGGGDASNIYIESAAEVVSATTAQTAAMTGTDSADWAAAIATYKMSSAASDISNTPTSKGFGILNINTTYWSNDSEPSWPLVDGDAYFTITNNGAACSITIESTDFTGGVGWNLGTPASDTVRLTSFEEGDGSGDGLIITNSPQAFIAGLTTNVDWELKFETATAHTDGVLKTATVTLTATLD